MRGLREVTKIPINLTTKRFAQLQVATTRFKEEQNVELSSVDGACSMIKFVSRLGVAPSLDVVRELVQSWFA